MSEVDVFEDPKVDLEQVPTSAHLAARVVLAAAERGDLVGSFVGDLGVGTGMLSIASSLMGAAQVVGFDVDEDALDLAWVNMKKLEIDNLDLVQCDLNEGLMRSAFDTVVMNPPFGTRKAGIDTIFLLNAMKAANAVYSLHKTSTREHFVKLAKKNDWNIEVVAELRYDIPKTHKFHKHKSKDIYVDLYRFSHKSKEI